ncbi:PREDICTED: protection of telomeres protein 1-like [Poecilia mexicana]|uniref:protection of telomeres protein 1-like n=1 Tax=Poecilia mexicana TaxID=48701 RepID=UPI00072E0CDF|nr:PREDICTED: protection of telomeres protein 1-like [Poecilia mexicana]
MFQDILWVSGFTVGKSPTANKDKLHPCNLLLSGDDACIYVSKQRPPEPRSPLASRGSSLTPAVDLRTPRAPRYTYVRLDELKNMAVVNVYGVVAFFKQPFKSRGTDYCSSLKITDQSEHKIGCTIFCEKLEDHPRIFQTGDIIRMHRVKVCTHYSGYRKYFHSFYCRHFLKSNKFIFLMNVQKKNAEIFSI